MVAQAGSTAIDYAALSELQKASLATRIIQMGDVSESNADSVLRSDAAFSVPADQCVFGQFTHEQVGMLRDLCRDNGERDPLNEVSFVAREIIYAFLGHGWVLENISEQFKRPEQRMGFLRLAASAEDLDSFRRQDRLIGLADALFAVQYCEGFDWKLTQLRSIGPTRPEVHIEDAFIELDFAKSLVRSSHQVEFVRPTRVKEQDFDLRVVTAEKVPFCVELKCKREGTLNRTGNFGGRVS